jgi:hypothetical protein
MCRERGEICQHLLHTGSGEGRGWEQEGQTRGKDFWDVWIKRRCRTRAERMTASIQIYDVTICDAQCTMSDPSIPPPPTVITPDDYHAADAARRRLAQKSSLVRILAAASKTPKKAKNVAKHTVPLATATPPITAPLLDYSRQSFDPDMIQLDDSKLDASQEGEDQYEWAIVYENQRG